MTDERNGHSQSKISPYSIGLAHVLQVLIILFLLGVSAAFWVTRSDIVSLQHDIDTKFNTQRAEYESKLSVYESRLNSLEVRMGVSENSIANVQKDEHDYAFANSQSLEKINKALSDLRMDLSIQLRRK